jgi:hypothetical protein
VLSAYVVRDWREGCERSMQILRYGGMGHTMSIHSENEQVILEFGLKKPAFRISVNTPSTFGSIGLTTGLAPAMTLGCGGWGGNITSDNITPKHLLNIKRLAWELRTSGSTGSAGSMGSTSSVLPKAPAKPAPSGLTAAALSSRIDAFLASRGITPPSGTRTEPTERSERPERAEPPRAEEFVSESDVREAMKQKRQIVVGEKTIVTPAARELGEAHKVFVQTGLRG